MSGCSKLLGNVLMSLAVLLTYIDESNEQLGLPGQPGDTGAPGSYGSTGAQGATGEVGISGDVGSPGPDGPDYMSGPTGDTGYTGARGIQGVRGPPGKVGSTGATGPTGQDGFSLIGNPIVKTAFSGSVTYHMCTGGQVTQCWTCSALSVNACAASAILMPCGKSEEICYTSITKYNNGTVFNVQRGCRSVTSCSVTMLLSPLGGCSTSCQISPCRETCTTCNVTVSNCIQPPTTATSTKTTPTRSTTSTTTTRSTTSTTPTRSTTSTTTTRSTTSTTTTPTMSTSTTTQSCIGISGPPGNTGQTGPGGPTGLQGPKGLVGLRGFTGSTGPPGATGRGGPPGATGATGGTGVQGLDGFVGPTGIVGAGGSKGVVNVLGFNWPSGAIRSKRQTQGCPGPKGSKGQAGSPGGTGSVGLKGFAGAKGVVGATGPKGAAGAAGVPSFPGLPGITGAKGVAGSVGATGSTGATGVIGPPGDYIAWLRSPVVTSVTPQYGSLSGGTRVTLSGQLLVYNTTVKYVPDTSRRRKRQQLIWTPQIATIKQVFIGNTSALVDASNSTQTMLIVTTQASSQTGQFPILFQLSETTFDTSFTFVYRDLDVTVGDIEPLQHLTDGGTLVDVTGENFTPDNHPTILLTVVVTRFDVNSTAIDKVNSTETQDCVVVNTTHMQCLMPPINLEPDFRTQLKNSVGGNISDPNSPGVAVYYGPNGIDRSDIYVGIGFDGVTTYRDLSETKPSLKMQFYLPPTIDCKPASVIIYNPSDDQSVTITGSLLTRGNRLIDIHVSIGDGVCHVTQLTDNEITCVPPQNKPGKGNDTICGSDQLALKISIGFFNYSTCRCLQYSSSVNIWLIIGLSVGLGLLVIFIVVVIIACLVYRRRRQLKRPKTSAIAGGGNRTVPNTAYRSSLFTDVDYDKRLANLDNKSPSNAESEQYSVL